MFYDPERSMEQYRRRLPHWEQGLTWSFVTFRLADALPHQAMVDWTQERRNWLAAVGVFPDGALDETLDLLSSEQRRLYLREFGKRFHALLDAGHGSCVLRHPECSQIVADAFRYFDGRRYDLGSYVVMPNHVHVLVAPHQGQELVKILHSWKRFTAREINKLTGQGGQFWQHESFDHLVRHAGSMEAIVRYIQQNPVKARLQPGEYLLG